MFFSLYLIGSSIHSSAILPLYDQQTSSLMIRNHIPMNESDSIGNTSGSEPIENDQESDPIDNSSESDPVEDLFL